MATKFIHSLDTTTPNAGKILQVHTDEKTINAVTLDSLLGATFTASPTFAGLTVSTGGKLTLPDGTAAAPTLVFASDADSGFYYNAKGFGWSVDGVSKFSINNAGLVSASSSVYATGFVVTVGGGGVTGNGTNGSMYFQQRGFTAAGTMLQLSTGTWSNTSGQSNSVAIIPTYNQASGTAANTDLLINRTQTAVGSGLQYLIDAQVSTASKFSVDNAGNVNLVGVLSIDGTQVLSNRVIDARIDDTINSGDATTDGVIDAIRDALIAHGIIAAA